MTLKSAVEKAVRLVTIYGDENRQECIETIYIVSRDCCDYFNVSPLGCENFKSCVKDGTLLEQLCLKHSGSIPLKALLGDNWEIKAIKGVYITADELSEV